MVFIDGIESVVSEGIDRKRFIRDSKKCGTMLNATHKDRNEQADLLRKEVMTSYEGIQFLERINSSKRGAMRLSRKYSETELLMNRCRDLNDVRTGPPIFCSPSK